MGNRNESMSIEAVQRVAERILSEHFSSPARTAISRITDEGRRNQVYRCEILDASVGLPKSVIVKQSMHEDGILNDWAGLRFLSDLHTSISPRYYGGDASACLLVIEDIRDAVGIHEVLLHGTSAEAESILLRFAEVIGEMHARSAGRHAVYQSIRNELQAEDHPRNGLDMAEAVRNALAEAATQIPLQLEDSFDQELSDIVLKMHSPGPFYVFSHGDPCPDNWLCNEEGARLIDYEFAGYKHALLDGAYAHIMFPTCWCAGIIPETLVSRMEEVYRRELSRGCPEAADDSVFQSELFAACAYWAWHTVQQLLKGALEGSDSWGIATTRARIVSRLKAVSSMTEGAGKYPAVHSASSRLCEIVAALWPDDKLELYPCFAGTAYQP